MPRLCRGCHCALHRGVARSANQLLNTFMKRLVAGLLLFAVSISGCTTKSKARVKAQAAFLAGQQQSFSPQNRLQTRTVWVRGEVRNQLIPWNEELTLSKAILAAEYQGFLDPKEIV